MKTILQALRLTLSDSLFRWIAISISLNALMLNYFLLLKTTTLHLLWTTTTPFYAMSSLLLTIVMSLLTGLIFTLLLFVRRQNQQNAVASAASGTTATFVGALSVGCPTCGAYLLPLFGIAGGLSFFPFQGLELKVIAIALSLYALHKGGQALLNPCPIPEPRIESAQNEETTRVDADYWTLTIDFTALWRGLAPTLLVLALVIGLSYLPSTFGLNFSTTSSRSNLSAQIAAAVSSNGATTSASEITGQVMPKGGVPLGVSLGSLGKQLVDIGAIDYAKFNAIYSQAGSTLPSEQLATFAGEDNTPLVINSNNSYFLLNFFWALGLANQNPILQDQMVKSGSGRVDQFASTGGWTLATKPIMEVYGAAALIPLTPDQQKIVEEVAEGVYRPCCNNSTAFPDCNHGMAALGLAELMASEGNSADEIFAAMHYVNAYWFPQQYVDLASYFQAKEGKSWSEVDPRVALSSDYSSSSGYQRVNAYLSQNNLKEEAPSGGGGCGV